MPLRRMLTIIPVVLALAAIAPGADVILNEYNAVGGTDFLGGGNSAVDDAGGRASDAYFGRVQGNGGDWFELVVVRDGLDLRGWQLDILASDSPAGMPVLDETLDLTDHVIWSNLRSGTIITVSEDVPSDISYNPAGGDWWINVQANDDADGLYIEASSFPVSNNNWQLQIRNAAGTVVFGPAGEGVSPVSGVGGTEVFRLEADPGTSITPRSDDYDDGADFSTFGAPNRWGAQDLSDLRTVVGPNDPAIALLFPSGGEVLPAGEITTIRWDAPELREEVLIEFSLDGGVSWSPVYPPNHGNMGQYRWLVPAVATEAAKARVSSAAKPATCHVSETFAILQCDVEADLTGDCLVNFFDLAIMASTWLDCGDPLLWDCLR